ncbi:MAG: hypothetical protein N2C14_04780, partial [Planctomycetales bacterium]
LPVEELESRGVTLASSTRPENSSAENDESDQRQMRARELEKRQKLWRWLILAALGILMVETWTAGYFTRRVQQQASGQEGEQA